MLNHEFGEWKLVPASTQSQQLGLLNFHMFEYMFESETDSKVKEEKQIIQGCLQVYVLANAFYVSLSTL